MKNIIWIPMLLISCSDINGQHSNVKLMKFMYVGESDKPIPSLLITTNKNQLKNEQWLESVLVSEKTLYFINKFIIQNGASFYKRNNVKIHGNVAFKINVNNNEYGFIERKEAFSLFTGLKAEIGVDGNVDFKDAEQIKQYISRVLPRIAW